MQRASFLLFAHKGRIKDSSIILSCLFTNEKNLNLMNGITNGGGKNAAIGQIKGGLLDWVGLTSRRSPEDIFPCRDAN